MTEPTISCGIDGLKTEAMSIEEDSTFYCVIDL
jgi:hypothetical protein